MNLIIRGDLISIPKYVIKKIPYFQSLNQAISCETMDENEMESNTEFNTIKIDVLSPELVILIIDFFRNDTKLSVFKANLTNKFDENCIKRHLQYLGLDELFKKIFYTCSHKIFFDKLVVCDIIKTIEHNIQEFCIVTYNGNLIQLCSFDISTDYFDHGWDAYEKITIKQVYFDITNTMIRINDKINKNKKNQIMIHFESGIYYLKENVIENNGSFFIDFKDYVTSKSDVPASVFPYMWLLYELNSYISAK